jgi:hypothetical protein
MAMIGFILGLFVGATLGVLGAAMAVASRDAHLSRSRPAARQRAA